MTLFSDLLVYKDADPLKPALLDENNRVVTYRKLLDTIDITQMWLKSLGLQSGDTLMALMPNTIETIILFLASMRAGLSYAPLPCTSSIHEITRWKTLTKARFCVFADPVNLSLQQQIESLDWSCKRIDTEKNLSFSGVSCATPDMSERGQLIIPSSGSTGDPKAMVLDINCLWVGGKAFLQFHQIENQTHMRFWNYLPMSYLGGLFNLTLIPLASGGSVFVDDSFNGKTFLTFWSVVERFEINSLWLVPTILRGLLTLVARSGSPSAKFPKIENCFLGTAPISLREKQQFYDAFGVVPLENFGLSETTFITSEKTDQLGLRKEGSVGSILPYVEAKCVPLNSKEPSVSQIWVKSPYVMLGYLDGGGNITLPVDEEGFLPTGDVGEIINGQLHLHGRCRDIIKKGGVLVALREIERLTESHPDIQEAIAVKTDHAFYGESYFLYVRTYQKPLDQKQLICALSAWLHEQLVRHKWPEEIIWCEDFPRTQSGKIQKHHLKTKVSHA